MTKSKPVSTTRKNMYPSTRSAAKSSAAKKRKLPNHNNSEHQDPEDCIFMGPVQKTGISQQSNNFSSSKPGPSSPPTQRKSDIIAAQPSETVPIETSGHQITEQHMSTADISVSSSASRPMTQQDQADGHDEFSSVGFCTISGRPGLPRTYRHTCNKSQDFLHPLCEMKIMKYTPQDSEIHICSKCFSKVSQPSNSTNQHSGPQHEVPSQFQFITRVLKISQFIPSNNNNKNVNHSL